MSSGLEFKELRGFRIGKVVLEDGTVLKLRVAIVGVRESGFSPFGGVNFEVKPIGGVFAHHVPDELRDIVRGKPLAPPQPPHNGWEITGIKEQEPAFEEVLVKASKGLYVVRVEADAVMASRNLEYRDQSGNPLYWLHWSWKISWNEEGGEVYEH